MAESVPEEEIGKKRKITKRERISKKAKEMNDDDDDEEDDDDDIDQISLEAGNEDL